MRYAFLGFIYDVIFAHKPTLLDVASEHSARAVLRVAINSVQ